MKTELNYPMDIAKYFSHYLYRTFFLCIIICSNSLLTMSQGINPPTDCYLINDSTGNYVEVMLSDTLTISQIEIKIGTGSDNNDVFAYTFTYDQTGSLPSGYSYVRNGIKVRLGIGPIEYPPIAYVNCRLSNGNLWSGWYQFVSNP